MKYILIALLFICASAKAQFPAGTDTLRNYNNRFIDNDPRKAFTNLRLHNLLAGMINYMDSIVAGNGINIGMDTAFMFNDSLFTYRKGGVFTQFVIRGSNPAASGAGAIYRVPFNNGLGQFANDSNFKFDKSVASDAARLIVGPTSVSSGGYAKINATSDNMNALGLTSYGTGLNTIIARRARGSITSPTALQSDDDLFNLSGRGHNNSDFTTSRAAIYARATQNWNADSNGTAMHIATTPNHSDAMADRVIINDSVQVAMSPAATSDSIAGIRINANGLRTLVAIPKPASATPIYYTNTAFVDSAHGDDGTALLDRLDRPFATIDAALDAGASVPSLHIKLSFGSYAKPTPAKMRSYLWIEGSGKPGHNGVISMTGYAAFSNTAPTRLKGGTIINGKIQSIDHSFIKISDLGVDQGSDYVAGGGTENDGIGMGSLTSTTPFPLMQGLEILNVICLLKDPNSLFHGIVIENHIGLRIVNCEVIFGTHGIVSKGVGGTITNCKISDCATDAFIIKSDSYAYSWATQLDGFECASIFSSSCGGVYILASTGPAHAGIKIQNGSIRQCTFGVLAVGTNDALTVNNVQVQGGTGIGFYFDANAFVSVSNCFARGTSLDGFHVAGGTSGHMLVSDCMSVGNGGDGFEIGSSAGSIELENCSSNSNTGYGFNCGSNVYLNTITYTSNGAGNVNGSPIYQLPYLTRQNKFIQRNIFNGSEVQIGDDTDRGDFTLQNASGFYNRGEIDHLTSGTYFSTRTQQSQIRTLSNSGSSPFRFRYAILQANLLGDSIYTTNDMNADGTLINSTNTGTSKTSILKVGANGVGSFRGDSIRVTLVPSSGTALPDSVVVPGNRQLTGTNELGTSTLYVVPRTALFPTVLRGQTTWDPASIGANSSTTTTVSVTGAALGDQVLVSKTSGSFSNGEIYFGYVSSAGQVTIQLQNGSGATFDIASADYNIMVLKQ